MSTEAQKARNRAYAKHRVQAWRDLGLCERCGQRPPEDKLKACRQCLDRIDARRKNWEAAGLCNRCGKAPPVSGHKTCEKCYAKRSAAYLQAKKDRTHQQIYRKDHSLCATCGTLIDRSDLFQGKRRATCDACRAEQRRKKATQGNPRYAHILERDGYACRLCGHAGYLCVHHIDGVGASHHNTPVPIQERHDDPDNLITLCRHCHYATIILRKSSIDRQLAAKLILAD